MFAILINLQDQVEEEAQRINRHKRFNDDGNRIIRDGISIGLAVDEYSLYTCLSSGRLDGLIADMRRNFHDAQQLSDSQSIIVNVQSCERDVTLIADELAAAKQSIQNGTFKPNDGNIVTKKIYHRLMKQASRVAWLQLGQQNLRTDDPSNRLREQIQAFLKWALCLSLLFPIGAAVYSKHLVGRLSRLSDNASSLAKGEPLLSPIGGSDEVAELDRNFHHAAELIEAAKRMRQEVTAMITHDLKTPLQSVRSFLEMVQNGFFGELNEAGTRLLSTTEKACKRMVNLIDSVLQLEKLRTHNVRLQTTAIELAPLLDKCLDSVKLLADDKNVVLVRAYNQHNTVKGDAFWLEQVFVNILSNAIKFTRANSTVSVSTDNKNKHAEIRITDEGSGIGKDQIELIFDRFHRVQSTAGIAGTGLGLPIAKELIQLHYGSISIESELGKGSTFAIRLPLSPETDERKSAGDG